MDATSWKQTTATLVMMQCLVKKPSSGTTQADLKDAALETLKELGEEVPEELKTLVDDIKE